MLVKNSKPALSFYLIGIEVWGAGSQEICQWTVSSLPLGDPSIIKQIKGVGQKKNYVDGNNPVQQS